MNAEPTTPDQPAGSTTPAGPTLDEIAGRLDNPRDMLADALLRVHRADAMHATSDGWRRENGLDGMADDDSRTYQLEAAGVLARIAEVAHAIQPVAITDSPAIELQAPLSENWPDLPDGMAPAARPIVPQAVRGVRCTATLAGLYVVGQVGGREWLHVPGHGFIDVTGFDETNADNETSGHNGFRLAGRLVSATPDHALIIDDGGVGHTLPRALIVEVPDDGH